MRKCLCVVLFCFLAPFFQVCHSFCSESEDSTSFTIHHFLFPISRLDTTNISVGKGTRLADSIVAITFLRNDINIEFTEFFKEEDDHSVTINDENPYSFKRGLWMTVPAALSVLTVSFYYMENTDKITFSESYFSIVPIFSAVSGTLIYCGIQQMKKHFQWKTRYY